MALDLESFSDKFDPLGKALGLHDVLGSPKKGKGLSATQKQINKYNRFIRAMLQIQQEVQPQVTALERGSAESLSGIYEDILGPSADRMAATSNTAQRTADLGDFEALGADFTRARTAAAEADPLVSQLRAAAMEDLALGSDMDPTELRKAQQMSRMNRSGYGFGQGSENDLLHEALALMTRGEELRGSRIGRASNVLGATGGGAADTFLAITGRPSTSMPFAQGAYGQSVGDSRFNPVEKSYSSDLLNSYYAQKMNNANNSTAIKGALIGAAGQAIGGGIGAFCWVAREVFGAENPQWLRFREWVLTKAPQWFMRWYLRFGPRVAEWLRLHPWAKGPVRWWMESRIATLRKV